MTNTAVGNAHNAKSLNNFRRQAIRDMYYNLSQSNVSPTVDTLAPRIMNELGLQVQPLALIEIFNNLGFENVECGINFIEKHENRLNRIKYLRAIKKLRESIAEIVYLSILDTTVGNIEIRVMVAATDDQVIKESVSVGNADHMNPEYCRNWITNKVMTQVSVQSVLVMDQSCYERFVADFPNNTNTVTEMKEWLQKHKIPFGKNYLKPELYEIIKKHRSYYLDLEFYAKAIIMPDDHPGFHPLEIVWYNMEPYDLENVTSLRGVDTLKSITILGMLKKQRSSINIVNLRLAISTLFKSMLTTTWHSCIKKVIEYENKTFNMEVRYDQMYENKLEPVTATEAISQLSDLRDMNFDDSDSD